MVNASTNKVAFFNIADLHVYHSLANRFDYLGEITAIVERLGKLVNKYKGEGYHCVSLINGDVSHKGNASDNLNNLTTQVIKLFLSYFDENYLNFGNHEFTYYKNNPIFKFIKTIEDSRIQLAFPHIVGTSLVEDLKVVERLEYDNFEIVFTPYGFLPQRGTKEISHLVMHDDLVSDHSYNKLTAQMPEYRLKRKYLTPGQFDYVYCGHNHLVHETWEQGGTKVFNLGSLGRSNVNEVEDKTRGRTIPVILSENGVFVETVEERIQLHKRADIVDEEKLEKSREVYQNTKERSQERNDLSISRAQNPIESLEEDIIASERRSLKIILDILKEGRLVEFREVKLIGELEEYEPS